jgi:DTW domain-containing protein YfiP
VRKVEPPTDPVELVVFTALRRAGVAFTMPRQGPDFILSDGTCIECKRMFTERVSGQLQAHPETILIQGLHAARTFAGLLRVATQETDQ